MALASRLTPCALPSRSIPAPGFTVAATATRSKMSAADTRTATCSPACAPVPLPIHKSHSPGCAGSPAPPPRSDLSPGTHPPRRSRRAGSASRSLPPTILSQGRAREQSLASSASLLPPLHADESALRVSLQFNSLRGQKVFGTFLASVVFFPRCANLRRDIGASPQRCPTRSW